MNSPPAGLDIDTVEEKMREKTELTPVGWVDGIYDVSSDIYGILSKVDKGIYNTIKNSVMRNLPH